MACKPCVLPSHATRVQQAAVDATTPSLCLQRMSSSLSLVLSLVLVLAVCCLLPRSSGNEISFQAHSYNDLRQWPSLILKGAQWIKIDMNYAQPAFCLSNRTATERVRGGEGGCFLLNHDDLSLNRTAPYNTSDDVLSFIAALSSSAWLHGEGNVSIALCFKYGYGGVCDDSPDSRRWLALTQAFYDGAQQLITQYNLSLLFVLDGAGAIDLSSPCLVPLFPALPSTWIPTENSPGGMYRNDTPAYARMNLLNIQQLTFDNVSGFYHYGKFVSSPFPWLLWEPSDQRAIAAVAQQYLAVGIRHKPGFRFAINIDPLQFGLYVSNSSQVGLNVRRPELEGRGAAFVTGWTEAGRQYIAVMSQQVRQAGNYSLHVYGIDAALSVASLSLVFTQPELPLPGTPLSVVTVELPSSGNASLTFISFSQLLCAYPSSSLADWRSWHSPACVKLPAGDAGFRHELAVSMQSDSKAAVVVGSVNPDGSGVLLSCFEFDLTARTLQARAVANVSSPEASASSVSGVSVAMANERSDACPVTGKGSIAGAVAFSTSAYNVYLAAFCLDDADEQSWSLEHTGGVFIDVGSSPSLSVASAPSSSSASASPYLLLTLSDSYCYNAEAYNKQADSGLCDHQPVATSQVLSYSYGRLADATAWLQQARWGVGGGVICNPFFLHGSYDMGRQQSSVLWPVKDEQGRRRLALLDVHAGQRSTAGRDRGEGRTRAGETGWPVNSPALADNAVCGRALYYDGLVIDGWLLPQQTTWRSDRLTADTN